VVEQHLHADAHAQQRLVAAALQHRLLQPERCNSCMQSRIAP
jgi:hypothetical protein